jgi:hypothetical protein
MSLFIEHPALAAVLGVLFFVAYRLTRQRAVGVAALAWLAYGGYEAAIERRWLCSGECDIRVDLLMIYPALLVLSVTALVQLVRWRLARLSRPGVS